MQNPIETADATIETAETNIEIIETIPIVPSKTYSHDEVMEAIRNEVRFTSDWNDKGEDTTIQISQADADRLLRIAYAEGGTEGIQGQLLIMQTVWNRVQSDDFPDSIKEVIEQQNAFASVSEGTYQTAVPSWETHIALSLFEQNHNHDANLIGFETNDNGSALLKYFDFYEQYRNHTFYQIKKD